MIERLGLLQIDKKNDMIKKVIYENNEKNHIDSYIECIICMNDGNLMLNCGHVICLSCAHKWYTKKNSDRLCVYCKKPIKMDQSYCLK